MPSPPPTAPPPSGEVPGSTFTVHAPPGGIPSGPSPGFSGFSDSSDEDVPSYTHYHYHCHHCHTRSCNCKRRRRRPRGCCGSPNCYRGKPCGNSCIARWKECHID